MSLQILPALATTRIVLGGRSMKLGLIRVTTIDAGRGIMKSGIARGASLSTTLAAYRNFEQLANGSVGSKEVLNGSLRAPS